MKEFGTITIFAAVFTTSIWANADTADKGYREEVQTQIRYQVRDPRACIFGCVQNTDGTYSPIYRVSTRREEVAPAVERVLVPDRSVRYSSPGRHCSFYGCSKNEDGSYSPRISVPKSEADKYLQAPGSNAKVVGWRGQKASPPVERKDEDSTIVPGSQAKRFPTAKDRSDYLEQEAQAARIRQKNKLTDVAGRDARMTGDEVRGQEKRFPTASDRSAFAEEQARQRVNTADEKLKAAQDVQRRAQNMDDRVDANRDVTAAQAERDRAANELRAIEAARARRELTEANSKVREAAEVHRRAENLDDRVDAERDLRAAQAKRDAAADRVRADEIERSEKDLKAANERLRSAEESHRRAENMDDRVDGLRDIEAAKKERDAIAARLDETQVEQARRTVSQSEARLKAAEEAYRRAENMDDRADARREIEEAKRARDLASARIQEDEAKKGRAELAAADQRVKAAEEAHRRAENMDDRVDAQREIEAAKKDRDAIAARTKADEVAKTNGSLGAAVPGSDTTATNDPCAGKNLTHRQAEDCSMKKYNDAVKEADQAVARCFYSGFAAKNGGQCEPVRSTEDAKKLGSEIKGVEKTDCGSGMVMCNPLVFGIQSDKKAICVRGTKDASKECAVKANLKSKEAQDRYKELMKDKGNQAKLAELKKKHKRSCDNAAMVNTGAGAISQTKLDGAFTANVRNRRNEKSKEDHERTCKVLGDAIAYAEGVTRTNEEPAKAVVAEPAVDGTGTR